MQYSCLPLGLIAEEHCDSIVQTNSIKILGNLFLNKIILRLSSSWVRFKPTTPNDKYHSAAVIFIVFLNRKKMKITAAEWNHQKSIARMDKTVIRLIHPGDGRLQSFLAFSGPVLIICYQFLIFTTMSQGKLSITSS